MQQLFPGCSVNHRAPVHHFCMCYILALHEIKHGPLIVAHCCVPTGSHKWGSICDVDQCRRCLYNGQYEVTLSREDVSVAIDRTCWIR